ncbi:MAG: hypothetical protein ACE5EX_03050 [Phycisphaerae bacterium]
MKRLKRRVVFLGIGTWCGVMIAAASPPTADSKNGTKGADHAPARPTSLPANDIRVQPGTDRNIDSGDYAALMSNETQDAIGVVAAPILDGDSKRLSFQALLTDGAGAPLAGSDVTLEFNIYDAVGRVVQGPIGPTLYPMNRGVVDAHFPVDPRGFDGSGRFLGVSVNGERELAPRVPLTTVPYALRVDRVTSEELDDALELGTATSDGSLNIWDQTNGLMSLRLSGGDHSLSTWGADGGERVRLWGPSWGEILLYDGMGNERTVRLSAGPNLLFCGSNLYEFGGQLTLSDSSGSDSVFLGGNSATVNALGGFQVTSGFGCGSTVFGALSKTAAGARLSLFDAAGTRALLAGPAASGAGGFLEVYQRDGDIGVAIDGDSGGAGNISIRDGAGVLKVFLDVTTSNNNTGQINIYDGNGDATIVMQGQENTTPGGAQIEMRNAAGKATVEIDADGGSGPRFRIYQNDGDSGILMDGNSLANGAVGGGRIRVRNADNITRVFIDGNYQNTGFGRIRADIVRVQGGVDLAEPFNCRDRKNVKPGMVMSIDPTTPGQLMIASEPYDRKVAGIVSGAGGIMPRITLSQEGVVEGDHLIALTGRVYCLCDASFGAIDPGDMLTTSKVPGHAMKVTDYERSSGATIGKAMTSLAAGKGLVMVLVQPQ